MRPGGISLNGVPSLWTLTTRWLAGLGKVGVQIPHPFWAFQKQARKCPASPSLGVCINVSTWRLWEPLDFLHYNRYNRRLAAEVRGLSCSNCLNDADMAGSIGKRQSVSIPAKPVEKGGETASWEVSLGTSLLHVQPILLHVIPAIPCNPEMGDLGFEQP
jgi:hypothetical protein